MTKSNPKGFLVKDKADSPYISQEAVWNDIGRTVRAQFGSPPASLPRSPPWSLSLTHRPPAPPTQIFTNALKGYDATLFAYGQSGSGKSYSVVGSDSNPGIVPRFVDELFAWIAENETSDTKYEVEISMLELYLNACYDLLQKQKSPRQPMHVGCIKGKVYICYKGGKLSQGGTCGVFL